MKGAQKSGKRTRQNREADDIDEGDDDRKFEDAFKPKKDNNVNFGVLKNEKKAQKKIKKSKKKTLLLILVLIIAIGAAGAALYFTGLLNPVLERIGLRQPAAETQLSIEERETLLDLKETELNKKEETLNQREKQLEEKDLAQQTQSDGNETAKSFSEMIKGLSEDELSYLKKVSSIYSKMDAAEAATILTGIFDLTEISSILYYMQPAVSAAVLEQMEPAKAAEITQIMLS
ncbi:hypothetical protein SDC9_49957 [bioreactor metagenome]|uniref:Magnesium transporter MgtE intracellular domain-containing protein n=1 Tax=bioreactor metagenome TaxID=1076179 RepID=A0A644WIX5_9ZZZZ